MQTALTTPPFRNPQSQIRNTTFLWGSRTYVMGILNLTPDSFSGDGLLRGDDAVGAALAQAQRMLAEGADILDLGGESTRPGSEPVGAAEELGRVLPVLRELRRMTDVPISVDTSKAAVAEATLAAGADLINDVWGLRLDPDLAGVVAAANVPVVLMHNRMTPKAASIDPALGGRYVGVDYDNLIEDVKRELGICLQIAHKAGIRDENIILDPGIGFGKTVSQNLELLDRLDEIKSLGYPLLLGASRKSFIGYTLDLPPDQRAEATAATTAVGIVRGADIVRVHDVLINVRVARMTDAIVRRGVKLQVSG
ncbi:MAG: dihydropteroate synthase [Caldilineales bacterium]|nr:dihydropteroate synthase [Caldilineales bacterium]